MKFIIEENEASYEGLIEYVIEYGYSHIDYDSEQGGLFVERRKYLYTDIEDTDLIWNLLNTMYGNKLMSIDEVIEKGEVKYNYRLDEDEEQDEDEHEWADVWYDVSFISCAGYEGYSLEDIK